MTFVAFVLLFAVFALWLGESFASFDARIFDVHQNTPVVLLALAVVTCLIAGQFDLSIASIATLSVILTVGLTVNDGWSFGVVLPFVLLTGLLAGVLNAFLVVGLRINAFIATLGSGAIFLGLSRAYSEGQVIVPTPDNPLPSWFSGSGSFGSFATKVPEGLVWVVVAAVVVGLAFRVGGAVNARSGRSTALSIGTGVAAGVIALGVAFVFRDELAGVPWTVALLLVVATVLWIALTRTMFGRYMYATGGNQEAARLAGVPVKKQQTCAFLISGVLSALAGIVLAANLGSATPGVGTGFLLPAFAAAFLSTVLMSRGQFHVWGTVVGAIFTVWVTQALIIGGVPLTWNDVVNGCVLVFAVALSTAFEGQSPLRRWMGRRTRADQPPVSS